MMIYVTGTTTQDISFANQKAFVAGNPNYCGSNSYAFTGAMPAFLSMNPTAMTMTLSTSDPLVAGTYSYSFTVSLQLYPAIQLLVSFDVQIICSVFTLSMTTPPANQLVIADVTTQPLTWPFATSQVPNCGNVETFAFTSTPPTFLSIENQTNLGA
jgi:hypothetical protein